MTYNKYFSQGNWEPFVYKRLNEIITNYRPISTKDRPYVVFDFDNTSSIMDIEDNLTLYMVDNLLYKLTPQEFKAILLADGNFNQVKLIPDQTTSTVNNIVEDIISDYNYLYENYIRYSDKTEESLESIKETPHFNDFKTRLIFYYQQANSFKFTQQTMGQIWVAYWFCGYTKKEYKEILKQCYRKNQTNNIKKIDLSTINPGKSGHISTSYKEGLVFVDDLINLYTAFQNNGIETYIVSASPVDNVRIVASEFGYSVDYNHIIAMEYDLDDLNRISPRLSSHHPVVHGPGKSKVIKDLIMPRHNQQEPLAVFGDSMGDYNMMTDFKESKLNVLFNLCRNDLTQEIVDKAIDQYGMAEARYVLQGRDENKGCLHPHMETTLLASSDMILKPI